LEKNGKQNERKFTNKFFNRYISLMRKVVNAQDGFLKVQQFYKLLFNVINAKNILIELYDKICNKYRFKS